MANTFLRRFPAAVAAMLPRSIFPLAVLGGKNVHVAFPPIAERRAGTFAPAMTAAQLTALGMRADPVALSTTANDTVNRAPARGLAGDVAKRVTVGEAAAAPTAIVVDAVLFAGVASAAVKSVSLATMV